MLQILLYILIGFFSLIFLFGFIYRKISGVCTCRNQLTGKTVIVTGASAGIGKEAAFDFAQRGARVILACRNLEKAGRIKDWIVESTGNKNVICRHLELSDLESVRKFAKETIEKEKKIDVLDMNLPLQLTIMVHFFNNFIIRQRNWGAQTTIHLAVSDEGGKVTGEYFVDCKIAPLRKRPRMKL
ncbi:Protochlorophyllide reductase, chloroplastic [Armadillidium nasatum]|uniref:Protochlorophyllide reductase, chloroplastic n=1 Tax=Armadillidium nasatum TaxID=96803 RepID=A0A5N5SZA8_9CRUS|nr:Protochlorophyllide reductase, chloroplastic [Armadillidium nasatum]